MRGLDPRIQHVTLGVPDENCHNIQLKDPGEVEVTGVLAADCVP